MKFTSLIIVVAIFTLFSFEGLITIFGVNFKDNCCLQNSTKNTCQNNHQKPCSTSNGICNSNLSCHISGFVLTKFYTLDFPTIIIKQKVFPIVIFKVLSDFTNVNWHPPKL